MPHDLNKKNPLVFKCIIMPNVKCSPQPWCYAGTKIILPSAYRGKRNNFPFSPHFYNFHTQAIGGGMHHLWNFFSTYQHSTVNSHSHTLFSVFPCAHNSNTIIIISQVFHIGLVKYILIKRNTSL